VSASAAPRKLPLVFRAGANARKLLQQTGVSPESLGALAGAAGGPKWLVLSAIDRLLFGNWLPSRRAPLPLVGSSIGSWRFAAACQADPNDAITRLENLYIEQQFSDQPDIAEITAMGRHILNKTLGTAGAQHILQHPWARLHIVTAHCQGLTSTDRRFPLAAGFSAAFLANLLSRQRLGDHLHRHVFADHRNALGPEAFPDFKFKSLALTETNLHDALLASGSIPFVLQKVSVNGVDSYRDGGLIDYHMDLPLSEDKIVLMPHFSKRVTTGWLDKGLPWRSPGSMSNHLLIHPSDDWIASLPDGKIPDRTDFKRYANDYSRRVQIWREVAQRSEELAECLANRIEKNDWLDHVKPINSH